MPANPYCLTDMALRYGGLCNEHNEEEARRKIIRVTESDKDASHLATILTTQGEPRSLCARLAVRRPANWASRPTAIYPESVDAAWRLLDDEKSEIQVPASDGVVKIGLKRKVAETQLVVVTFFDDEARWWWHDKNDTRHDAQVFGILTADGHSQIPVPADLANELVERGEFHVSRPIVGVLDLDELHVLDAADAVTLEKSFDEAVARNLTESIRRWQEWSKPAMHQLPESADARLKSAISNIFKRASKYLESHRPPLHPDVASVIRRIQQAPSSNPPQQQFSEIIRVENIRLNKLIVDLYLKFTLAPLPDEDVLSSICHSIAQYCQAGACEMLLLHHETSPDDPNVIKRELRLKGAFGPWESYCRKLCS